MKRLTRTSRNIDGHRKDVVIVNCRDCTNALTYELQQVRVGKLGAKSAPDVIDSLNFKRLERQLDAEGWEHKRGATWALCPTCVKLRHPGAKDNTVVQFPVPVPDAEPGHAWMSYTGLADYLGLNSPTTPAAMRRYVTIATYGGAITRNNKVMSRNRDGIIERYFHLERAQEAAIRALDRFAAAHPASEVRPNIAAITEAPIELPAPEAPAEDTAMNAMPTPASEKPVRVPTPADRRAIADLLNEKYDIANGRYFGDWTDEQVAKNLDMPRAWVTEVRQFAYGAGGMNEMSDKKLQVVKDLERRVMDAEKNLQTLKDLERALAEDIKKLKQDVEAFRR